MRQMGGSIALALALAAGGAQAQPSSEELSKRLEQALRTIQDLQARVQALEAAQQPPARPAAAASAAPPAQVLTPPPAAAVAAAAAPAAPAASAADTTVAAAKTRLEPYGQVMLDAIYDARRMNPAYQATMRPSQIPVNCPADPGCGQDGAFVASVRQSSLGLRASLPTEWGELKTDLFFDLFGTDGGTNIHWQRAWAELGRWGVGQNDSNFMNIDAFPSVIDYWGPSGAVFLRNPQVRYAAPAGEGRVWAVSLEAPNSVIDTGKLSQLDPALGSGIAPHNRLPDLTGSLRIEGDWGHLKAAAILRRVGFQTTTTPNGQPAKEQTGYGLNLSGALKLSERGTLGWDLAGGKAIASYISDGGTDLAPDARLRAQAVGSLGYFVYYGRAWDDKLTSSIGVSQHRQDNTAGQAGNALHTGSYASANLLYALNTHVLLGGEYIWGRRENKDGASAIDSRFQFSTRVNF
ncbi:DcaP family trimeric outer membrane transporter [Roseateles violae]|uniref:DcaP family trimeric outer membrane transporter n=1 Tax=Roseateles violae TaxID=3058042 RepID=A0ABT8DMX4_9BURK|nr:DcaP family trimeric outer membrane transporter [Pelomonas sp. PFR6]MDN3919477.1 DcaP family trimeric outer membrane transporter [Pelomonas sp. PFR6]